jgi:hypothetical protein
MKDLAWISNVRSIEIEGRVYDVVLIVIFAAEPRLHVTLIGTARRDHRESPLTCERCCKPVAGTIHGEMLDFIAGGIDQGHACAGTGHGYRVRSRSSGRGMGGPSATRGSNLPWLARTRIM